MMTTRDESDSAAANVSSPPSFESALGELESIVERMESGKLSLEDALAAYQRGVEVLRYCQSALQDADQKIRVLEAGELREFPLPAASEDDR